MLWFYGFLKQYVLQSSGLQKAVKKQQTADDLLRVLETSKHPIWVDCGVQELSSRKPFAAGGLAAQLVESVTREESDEETRALPDVLMF